jgi:hypothetical protein
VRVYICFGFSPAGCFLPDDEGRWIDGLKPGSHERKSMMQIVAHANTTTTTTIRYPASIRFKIVFLPLSFGSLDSAATLSSDLFSSLSRVIAFDRKRRVGSRCYAFDLNILMFSVQNRCLVRCLKSRDELITKQGKVNLELVFTFAHIKSFVNMGIDLDYPIYPGYPRN